MPEVRDKPTLTFWQIWNMCFGFLGIQFGFALQNANVSRIFQTLGADMEQVPGLWIAAPLTGLLVQPVIGYFSDRTWTRLGRRRPYFLWGAIFSTVALLVMPNSPQLWIAAGTLWILDASLNVSMEPFRAFVGDQLSPRQRPTGYAMQSFFIGVGSVVASMLPWLLAKMGVANTAPEGVVPDTVRYAFYAGGAALLLAILWTIFRTREYPPEELQSFCDAEPQGSSSSESVVPSASGGWPWLLVGLVGAALVWHSGWKRELYVLAALPFGYGVLRLLAARAARGAMLAEVTADLHAMPTVMKRLAVVQFFSWFGLFCMWLYTTAAVTRTHYGTTDTTSELWNEGANWVGVLFAAYNGFAALAAIALPWMARRFGLQASHLVNLWLGGIGLLSMAVVSDPQWLLLSMAGVGIAWASILSLPYAMLSDSLPAAKMGVYMGIFNFFIVIPQLVAVSVLGMLLSNLFDGEPIQVLMLGGACFVVAGLFALLVPKPRVIPA